QGVLVLRTSVSVHYARLLTLGGDWQWSPLVPPRYPSVTKLKSSEFSKGRQPHGDAAIDASYLLLHVTVLRGDRLGKDEQCGNTIRGLEKKQHFSTMNIEGFSAVSIERAVRFFG